MLMGDNEQQYDKLTVTQTLRRISRYAYASCCKTLNDNIRSSNNNNNNNNNNNTIFITH